MKTVYISYGISSHGLFQYAVSSGVTFLWKKQHWGKIYKVSTDKEIDYEQLK